MHGTPLREERRFAWMDYLLWRSLLLAFACRPISSAWAQTVTPSLISIVEPSPVCSSGSIVGEACIELPPDVIIDKADVCFLVDDTGSFAWFVPTVRTIFSSLVSDLES